jgi:hypothetical protein
MTDHPDNYTRRRPKSPYEDTAAKEASMPRVIGSPFDVRAIWAVLIISFLSET